jgi:hypothetical protein
MEQNKQLESSSTSFIDHSNHEKILYVTSKLENVKNIMVDNIELALENSANLEHIHDQTEELLQQAGMFRDNSRKLKKSLCWDMYKLYILCGCITIIIVGLTIGVIMFVINQE